MVAKKAYPLRINEDVLAAMQRWSDDELRSLNAQIEYVLREALVKSGRVKLVQQAVTQVVEQTVDLEQNQKKGG
ncbi:hypothetical protein [Aliiglaciecola sp. M165]|uniref:hypothetical protein n=1 Tax=Aliiglaciecola sp. M165 TaxID=2593649 RepID=UPI00117ED717|nr:hypothetical protein [Aliiglaciecola sp. M165]TRY31798.1 hypothetical protein FM019_08100 [Aliiglaciecola sp. M165]